MPHLLEKQINRRILTTTIFGILLLTIALLIAIRFTLGHRDAQLKVKKADLIKLSHQDTLRVVQNSLLHFLNNAEYPKSFKRGPLQLLHSDVVRLDSSLKINGFSYVLLPKNSRLHPFMPNMDINNPLPFVEIVEFSIKADRITCLIIFRESGQRLETFLKQNLEVDSVNESEI